MSQYGTGLHGLAKLLNIVRPDIVVAGQRDAQQAAVMRKMIDDLCFGAEVVVTPIVHKEFTGIRVTPNVYTTLDEVDLFVDRVKMAIRSGIA